MISPDIIISRYSNLPVPPEVAAGCAEHFVRRVYKLGLDVLLGCQELSTFGRSWESIMDDMLDRGANFGSQDMIDAYKYYLVWAAFLPARLGIRPTEKVQEPGGRKQILLGARKGISNEIKSLRQFVDRQTNVVCNTQLEYGRF